MRLRRPKGGHHYQADVTRLVQQAFAEGWRVSEHDAAWAWQQHSDRQEASWLFLYDTPEENVAVLREHLVEEYDE
jgi:hypothetical protein